MSKKPQPITVREIDTKTTAKPAYRPLTLSIHDLVFLFMILAMIASGFVVYVLAIQGDAITTVYPILSGR